MNYIDRLLEKVNKGEIDKDEMCKRLTKKYRHRPVSDLIFEDYESDFYFGRVFPIDSDTDVKELLYDFMSTHTYDNGLPLTGLNYPPENPVEEHDYFEHYDRDQDLEEVSGLYDEIERVFYDEDNDEVNIVVNMTKEMYETDWFETYQGSSYEHDFS